MTWLSGFAKDPRATDPDLWYVVDRDDQHLAKFDHSGSSILDGTPVEYVDDDGDGWAEKIKPAPAFLRYVARSGLDAAAPGDAVDRLHGLIATSLFDARHATGGGRERALRRLRVRIDRFEEGAGAE